MKLDGKTIVISGAAGALGVVICKSLAERGARVVALDVVDDAEATERFWELPIKPYYFQCDISNEADTKKTLAQIAEKVGMPDVVCCHAGVVHVEKVQDYALEQFDELMNVNVRGAFVLAKAAVNQWLGAEHRGAQLIFTSSWVHDVPWPEITPYTASKAAMNALTRGFARELAASGIRANAIAPGIVGAGMALKTWNENAEYRARAEKAIPLGFLQPPESVADAVAFLSSDMSSYMTGSILTVDGGCSLYPNI
ncbi:SDR family NAD(P)-dependent oxidoreductase [Hoeflea sp. TYP-13]|uniref:SDR family NAD(P)-dependent oxidoreductase n=1 Tax=Hoeflea sp. TYP-13 TaxID=3230023 RepID=UPI0034C6CB48